MQTIVKFLLTFILAHFTALTIVPAIEDNETEQTISTNVERPDTCKSFKVEKVVVIMPITTRRISPIA